MVGIKMAVDALRYDKVLRWDAVQEKVVTSNELPSKIIAGLPLPNFVC
jgi:hypothetical protein